MRERSEFDYLDFLDFFFGSNFERVDLIRAALFLWINLFLTARSAREIAVFIFSAVLLFLAVRTAFSRLTKMSLLTAAFLFELLSALFAVFVTGIL